MKPMNGRIFMIQLSLVLLMNGAAAYCIFPLIGFWTSLLFGGLLLTGVFMIIFPRIGALPFSLLTLISSLPAVLTHNIVDIGQFTSQVSYFYGSGTPTSVVTLVIPYWITLGIGLFLICGYLVLSYLNSLQKEYQAAVSGNADIPETKKVTGRNIIIATIYPILAGLLAALLIIPLKAIQPAITEYMQNFPWSIIVFGLISVLLISGLVYWIGIFKHKSIAED